MKIAMINCSPRTRSASAFILNHIMDNLPNDCDFLEFNLTNPLTQHDISQILLCNAVVFASPLYIDSLPSHFMRELDSIYDTVKNSASDFSGVSVYAVMNCAFYESTNNQIALKIIENWCKRCGFSWKKGVGIGSGGHLLMGKKQEATEIGKKDIWTFLRIIARTVFSYDNPFSKKSAPKSFGMTMKNLCDDIIGNRSGKNIYIRAFFPRFVRIYNLMTSFSFLLMIKSNGLKIKDLRKKDL